MCKVLFFVISITFLIGLGEGWIKYSAEANIKSDITNEPLLKFQEPGKVISNGKDKHAVVEGATSKEHCIYARVVKR